MNKRAKLILFIKMYLVFIVFVISVFAINIFYSENNSNSSILIPDKSEQNEWSKTIRAYNENIFFDDEIVGMLSLQFILCKEKIENSHIKITFQKGNIIYNKLFSNIEINNEYATITLEGEVVATLEDYVSFNQMQDLFYECSTGGAISGALVGSCLSEFSLGSSILAGLAVGACTGGAWGIIKGALDAKTQETSCNIKLKINCEKINGIWGINYIEDLSEVLGMKARKCGDLYIM